MEDNKSWSFAVLEDCFGRVVAVQILDGSFKSERLTPLRLWVAEHFENYNNDYPGARAGWEKIFAPDDDNELNEEADILGMPANHGLTYRKCLENLLEFLDSNKLLCYKIEDTLDGPICDFYIQQSLEFYLDGELKHSHGRARNENMVAAAKAPWYEYVRDHFLWKAFNSSDDWLVFGRYMLDTPKFEELFNRIHVRYSAPTKTTPTTTTSTSAPKQADNKISQQQMYAMMMAPNGRCPKCNHPLSTHNVGLSAGKGAAGAFLAGTAGAIVGAAMGRKEYYCPACGYVR